MLSRYNGTGADLPERLENDFVDTLILARNLLLDLPHHRLDDLTKHQGIEVRSDLPAPCPEGLYQHMETL